MLTESTAYRRRVPADRATNRRDDAILVCLLRDFSRQSPEYMHSSSPRANTLLVIALVLGMGVRCAIFLNTSHLGTQIVDEKQYSQIARSIVAGHGFAWGPGDPTSIRPPLYPALLAAVWTISPDNLQAVRVLQILMGLATVVLVYLLGARVYGPTTGAWAAAAAWLYPSFIF